jgi:UDP-N-acetylmuramoyl-tripeptide--D-alanyl-D-alanine ligase
VEPRSLKYVAEACQGQIHKGSPAIVVRRVCTDSRQVQPGDLFVALAGDRFDGHDFLAQAAKGGAVAAIVERRKVSWAAAASAIVAVDNTRLALGRLAGRYRLDFAALIIAVGGSNGKTTTKELVAAVLRGAYDVLSSAASFNNDIGVPLSLLGLEGSHGVAVLEVGTNHPGELAPLVRMMAPRMGLITSLGREHLQFFGNMAGVVQEEGSLAELLPINGKLFLNGDSEWAETVLRRCRAPVIRVGIGERNDWRGRFLRVDHQGTTFHVNGPEARFDGEYRMSLLGRHQVVNGLLAVAVGAELGLSPEAIHRGLAGCRPLKQRLETWESRGVRVLDDSYNANADSMLAALETLRDLPCAGRRVAVLGDMAEQGPHSVAAHEEIGRRTAEIGVDALFAVGTMARHFAGAARAGGAQRVFEFADVAAAAEAVQAFVTAGDSVLIKASRVTRLEQVAERLRAAGDGAISV